MPIKNLPSLEFGRLFNLEVADAIRQAPSDAAKAAKVLLQAADLLRKHEPLPYALADYLADAFEAAMLKPESARLSELGFELNLKSRQKRRHILDLPAAYALVQKNYDLVDQTGLVPNVNTPKLAAILMKEGDCKQTHARSLLRQINVALEEEAKLSSKHTQAFVKHMGPP